MEIRLQVPAKSKSLSHRAVKLEDARLELICHTHKHEPRARPSLYSQNAFAPCAGARAGAAGAGAAAGADALWKTMPQTMPVEK